MACEYNAPEIVQLLLDKGADVLFVDSAGNTALHYASRCDNVEIVKMIVEKSGILPKPDVIWITDAQTRDGLFP